MAKGQKTGGRKKGTPNKLTQDVVQRLGELGCDPIEGMAKIAMDDSNDIDLRSRMYKELAQYVAPKRKALELDNSIHMDQVIEQLQKGRERVAKRKLIK